MAETINNGDRHFHEPNPKDSPIIKELKKEWNRIADLEVAEYDKRDSAESTVRQWEGKARAARSRIDQLREQRYRIEEAERALRGNS